MRRGDLMSWCDLVNNLHTVSCAATRAAKAVPPRSLYITTSWSRTADNGETPPFLTCAALLELLPPRHIVHAPPLDCTMRAFGS